jgi:cytochrome c oxidase cbb3-type subunit I/II
MRAIGGTLYLAGVVMMIINLVKTMRQGDFLPEEEAQAPALKKDVQIKDDHPYRHRWLERAPVTFLVWTTIAVLIGGVVEMVPMYLVESNVPTISSVKPYTPLEVHGRDIYIREGCVGCHSQMIRPFRSETERYGAYSKAGEFVYDRPFLWGSKRTGPDLHRVGRKYPDAWHYMHMQDPQSTSPGSVMPAYPWLLTQDIEPSSTPARIRALRRAGVPYPDGYEHAANEELVDQALDICASLRTANFETEPTREIVALIAYLQRLGTDIRTDLAQGGGP